LTKEANRREKGKALVLFLDVREEEEKRKREGGELWNGFRFLLDSFNFVK